MEFIDLKAQYTIYKDSIDESIAKVFEHGRFINGPEVKQLEEALSEYCGVDHCVGVGSGTHSLEIALRALGIGPGDEVVTVPFTWISTAEVVALVGAKPVFVDIDPVTYNMDPSQLEAALGPRTKAIMPVSLFGQVADVERIGEIAKAAGVPVIEDGAQSFGATRNGKRSCGIAEIGSTSFFPAKPFGCYGDGGALFTNDAELADEMRAIRSHGGLKRHHHTVVGTNGRLDTLQAATLLAKLPHFEDEVRARGENGRKYSDRLVDACSVPGILEGNTHVYGQYTIRVRDRDTFRQRMSDRSIPTAVYYPKCLHQQPVFGDLGYSDGQFPESEKAAREVVSLPMHPFLSEEDIETVVTGVKEALRD